MRKAVFALAVASLFTLMISGALLLNEIRQGGAGSGDSLGSMALIGLAMGLICVPLGLATSAFVQGVRRLGAVAIAAALIALGGAVVWALNGGALEATLERVLPPVWLAVCGLAHIAWLAAPTPRIPRVQRFALITATLLWPLLVLELVFIFDHPAHFIPALIGIIIVTVATPAIFIARLLRTPTKSLSDSDAKRQD